MKGTNETLMSVYHENTLLFCTDSFPVIPNEGEVISVRKVDENDEAQSTRYIVIGREYIYQKNEKTDSRDIFVIVRVREMK